MKNNHHEERMTNFREGKLLRLFVGEADTVDGESLVEAIMGAAKEAGLLGATAIRGIESFGQGGTTHTARLLRLSEDLPVIVEIVDAPEKIDTFVPTVDALFDRAATGGLATIAKVNIKRYNRS